MSLKFLPIELATQPRNGETIIDHYWVFCPERGLAFWFNCGDVFPQCNEDFRIASIIHQRNYPQFELKLIEAVYLGYDDGKSLLKQAERGDEERGRK